MSNLTLGKSLAEVRANGASFNSVGKPAFIRITILSVT